MESAEFTRPQLLHGDGGLSSRWAELILMVEGNECAHYPEAALSWSKANVAEQHDLALCKFGRVLDRSRSDQPIADAAYVDDPVFACGAELAAEAAGVAVDGACRAVGAESPHGPE